MDTKSMTPSQLIVAMRRNIVRLRHAEALLTLSSIDADEEYASYMETHRENLYALYESASLKGEAGPKGRKELSAFRADAQTKHDGHLSPYLAIVTTIRQERDELQRELERLTSPITS